MGKQGPCFHCGATSTPLWRNGPPEKPVLCNACGSRWRTKGTLANYFPHHIRELPGAEQIKLPKMKSISFKTNDQKFHNAKQTNMLMEKKREMPYCGQNYPNFFEEDTSNRSSSGSAISYTESCVNFGGADINELTACSRSNCWDTSIPSKKRTCLFRPKPSPVEELTRELCSILHEQQSHLSEIVEEDLIYEGGNPLGLGEIGHGGLLVQLPSSKIVKEESEASSFSRDGKSSTLINDYSESRSLTVHNECNGSKISDNGEKVKKFNVQMVQGEVIRDKSSYENIRILEGRDSPLVSVDLKDVASYETFMKLLSNEEQQQLLKHLTPIDTAKSVKSIRSIFNSPQFAETISDFQLLLSEGVFDLALVEEKSVDYRTLKNLVLSNFNKSKWVEYYKKLKSVKRKRVDMGTTDVEKLQ